eukprot:3510433-Lingulodinium_polyedra.AAC.1
MHQLWGAHRVSPAGLLSSARRIEGDTAVAGRASLHGSRTLGGAAAWQPLSVPAQQCLGA